MKNIYKILFCLLTSLSAFAQEKKDSTEKKERKIHIKIFYSPNYCLKRNQSKTTELHLSNTPSEDVQFLSYDSKDEVGMLGYQIGVLTEILLYKKIFVNIGMSYEKMRYQTISGTTIYVKQTNQFSSTSYDTTNNIKINHNLTFFSFPITLNYQFKKTKFDYSFGGGFSCDLLSRFSTTETPGIQYGQQQTIYKYEYHPIYFPLIVNVGFSYHINKFLAVGIEPNFKCYLSFSNNSSFINFNNQLKLSSFGTTLFLKF